MKRLISIFVVGMLAAGLFILPASARFGVEQFKSKQGERKGNALGLYDRAAKSNLKAKMKEKRADRVFLKARGMEAKVTNVDASKNTVTLQKGNIAKEISLATQSVLAYLDASGAHAASLSDFHADDNVFVLVKKVPGSDQTASSLNVLVMIRFEKEVVPVTTTSNPDTSAGTGTAGTVDTTGATGTETTGTTDTSGAAAGTTDTSGAAGTGTTGEGTTGTTDTSGTAGTTGN